MPLEHLAQIVENGFDQVNEHLQKQEVSQTRMAESINQLRRDTDRLTKLFEEHPKGSVLQRMEIVERMNRSNRIRIKTAINHVTQSHERAMAQQKSEHDREVALIKQDHTKLAEQFIGEKRERRKAVWGVISTLVIAIGYLGYMIADKISDSYFEKERKRTEAKP